MAKSDWHAEDIKAAIRKTGVTLTALALQHGWSESAVRHALRRAWPEVEAVIARHLGRQPQDIWPSRYRADGLPLTQSTTRHNKTGRLHSHRQINM
ncbi:helix-turn-helix domain-containing protein [Pannonibacter anstelovis]